MTTLQRYSLAASYALMSFSMWISRAVADEFGGPIPDIPGTPAPGEGSEGIRDVILNALEVVLNFLALAAVIFIIIAGIRLIVSQGNEEQRDKAKKTILYVVIGLIIILFARVIVGFFTDNPFDE